MRKDLSTALLIFLASFSAVPAIAEKGTFTYARNRMEDLRLSAYIALLKPSWMALFFCRPSGA